MWGLWKTTIIKPQRRRKRKKSFVDCCTPILSVGKTRRKQDDGVA